MPLITIEMTEILRFAAVLLRISGIMVFAPFFNNQSIPMQIRIAFTLVSTLVLAPSVPLKAFPAEFDLIKLPTLFLGEILLGIILGLAASFVFAGLQFAGQMISFQLGFSLINMIDPQTQVTSSVFSFFQNYIGLLFFLLINGHHWFLLAISESFGFLPVGGVHLQAPLVEYIVRLSCEIFILGLKIAGPVIAVGVIVDVVMGFIGRAAPQIHIIIVGMPLKVLAGLSCLSFSFYFQPRLLGNVFSTLFQNISLLLHKMV